jgi:crossover junction endodeoxyribonuclease RusA
MTALFPQTRRISFRVIGEPAPQGSKRHVGRGVMVESSKRVKPWREDVAASARVAMHEHRCGPFCGPVNLAAVFVLPRPKSLSRTKLALGPCRKPDLSKLLRATEDALVTAGLLEDDARIVSLDGTRKRFAEPGEALGAEIVIVEAGAIPQPMITRESLLPRALADKLRAR